MVIHIWELGLTVMQMTHICIFYFSTGAREAMEILNQCLDILMVSKQIKAQSGTRWRFSCSTHRHGWDCNLFWMRLQSLWVTTFIDWVTLGSLIDSGRLNGCWGQERLYSALAVLTMPEGDGESCYNHFPIALPPVTQCMWGCLWKVFGSCSWLPGDRHRVHSTKDWHLY